MGSPHRSLSNEGSQVSLLTYVYLPDQPLLPLLPLPTVPSPLTSTRWLQPPKELTSSFIFL